MSTHRKLMTICCAVVLSLGLAACGGGGGGDRSETPQPPPTAPDLGPAQMAAMAAATAADEAYKAAKQAAANAEMYLPGSQQAKDAAADADAAQDAAVLAKDASDRAAAATTLAGAEAERDAAIGHRNSARMAQTDAEAEQADAKLVVDSRGDAETAATAARTAATDARAHADRVAALTGADSASTTSANMYAMAAEEAADDAEEARDMANAALTGSAASGYASTAMQKQGDAEDNEMDADELRRQVQLAHDVDETDDEAEALMAARSAASDAASDAADNYAAARDKATMARTQANDAMNDAMRAMRARMDYPNAKKHADAAGTAADAAEDARDEAMRQSGLASDASEAAMAADNSTDAEAEQQKAEDARDAAHDEIAKADTGYMDAKSAAMDAEMYAGRHVIGLLIHANAQDLDLGSPVDVDLASALAKAKTDRLKAVSDQINMAAGDHTAVATDVGDRDQDSSTTGTAASGANATASWLGNNVDLPGTADTDESTTVPLSITVSIDGTTNLVWRTEAADEDDAATTEIDETIVTATRFDRGLGDFYGYSISDRGNHAIVFTDKKKGADQVLEVTAVTGRQVENEAVTAVAELALGDDKTGPTFTGVTWTPSGEEPLMGTLNCADAANCDIQISADGSISSIEGYTFTGSRDAVAAVAAAVAMEDADYLVFGVWLREDANGDTDGTPKTFAAFANGGELIAAFESAYAVLTGTATYNGKATGVHTNGSTVDYFEGDATLTADFGAIDTDAERGTTPPADTTLGTISGMINNIVAGGVANGDVINLRSADIEDTNSAFAGATRMGPGVDTNNDDVLEYTYNGTWSGNFFGANPATTGDDATPAAAPDAVAGTFGVSGTEGTGDAAVTRSYVGAFGARR